MKSALLLGLLSISAFATDIDKRPPAFPTARSQAVFTDFTNAYYKIHYDVTAKTAVVEAHIDLITAEDGEIVFDSVQEPTRIVLDGEETGADLIATPSKETLVRAVRKMTTAGHHHLEVTLPLNKELTEFTETGVKSAFWMSDLSDRGYIERYLPTNFAYDIIPMTFHVKFDGAAINQTIYSNGNVEKISDNEFKIVFEKNLNTSCPYYHTTPTGSFAERRFSVRSVDGRDLPAIIYIPHDQAARLDGLQTLTVSLIDELEKDYGAFLHQSITIYVNGPSGGMEYSGATITSERALGHELFHSYFARGIIPADGNSGWIDEALASWRDKGYSSIPTLAGTSKIAVLGTYVRLTDRLAYSFGERFMSLLNNKFESQGGLKPFLRSFLEKKAFDPIYVQDLIDGINEHYGTDVTDLFNQYVKGQGGIEGMKSNSKKMPHNENHPQLTIEQLKKLL